MLKLLFNIFLSSILVIGAASPKASATPEDSNKLRLDFESKTDLRAIEVETVTAETAEELSGKVAELVSKSDDRSIVSSDLPEVLEAASSFPKKVALLPINLLRTAKQNVANAWRGDKFGLAIITYRTYVDVKSLLIATHLSALTQSTASVYVALTAALVAVDKRSWPGIVRPFEERWQKILKISENPEERSKTQRTLLSYLGSSSATTAINLGFIPILAYDQIAAGNGSSLVTPLFMGVITTASAFSWYEFFRAIDEKFNPRAKAVSQFLLNTRTIGIATVASTVMLLNTNSYLSSPWIWLTASGAAGIPLMLNAQKIADWIERSPTVNKAAKMYGKVTNALKSAKATLTGQKSSAHAPIMVCKDVFARSTN